MTSSLIINMTSHSKTLLSFTSPHEMPGMSLSVRICLSCRASSEAAAADVLLEWLGWLILYFPVQV